MQRMGMVIGLKSNKIEVYKRLHAAVWPEILAKISDCNITNYSIFLREPKTCFSAIGNTTGSILPPMRPRWRPTRKRRSGGRSACRANSL